MYRRAKDRLAFNWHCIPGHSRGQILEKLKSWGFEWERGNCSEVNKPTEILIEKARQCLKDSVFLRGATMNEAPQKVDCSSLVKWLYGQIGICIPRRTAVQWAFGQSLENQLAVEFKIGDLVFKRGRVNCRWETNSPEIGHVGMVIEPGLEGTVIHATRKKGIIEVLTAKFIESKNYRGLKWIVPDFNDLVVLVIPQSPLGAEIETSDDLRYHLLTNL